jgi:hypothetical protein
LNNTVPPTAFGGNVKTKLAEVCPGDNVTLAGVTVAVLVPPAGATTTLPVKPLVTVTGIEMDVVRPLKPAAVTLLMANGAFSAKPPDADTESDPPAARPVKLTLPDCAALVSVAVNDAPEFDGQETVWLDGEIVTPAGVVAGLTFTLPVNPETQPTFTVTGADEPANVVTGTTDIVKPGTSVKLAVVVCVCPSVELVPVKVTDPLVVFSATLNVAEDPVLMLVEPPLNVTPFALAEIATAPLKGAMPVTDIVNVPVAWPSNNESELGDTAMLNPPSAVINTVTVVVWVTVPAVPVTLNVTDPAATVWAAPTWNVTEPLPLTVAPPVTVSPVGIPDAETLTDAAMPAICVTATVTDPLEPCASVNDPGAIEKSNGAVTLKPACVVPV